MNDITRSIIDALNSVDVGDRDLMLGLIDSGSLEDDVMNELYDYYFIQMKKWIYNDKWEKAKNALRKWKGN